MKLRKLSAVVALALTASMAVGCGNSASESSTTASNDTESSTTTKYEASDMSKSPKAASSRGTDTLVIGSIAFDGCFNPLGYSSSSYDWEVFHALFEPLMAPDEKGEMTEYRLAESYEISEDNLTYTFKLRDGLKWSDGQPLTAKDIAFSYKIMCDKTYSGENDFITGSTVVAGTKAYYDGTAEDISGIEVVDDQTIKFTLENPSSGAIYDLGTIEPVAEHFYKDYYKHNNTDRMPETYTNPGPTSGAYKFVSYTEGQEVKIEANDKSYLGAPKIKNVIWRVNTDDTKISMLKSGEVDLDQPTVNVDNVDQLEAAGFLGYDMFPTNGYGYIGVNHTDSSVLKDNAVIQALMTGLNRPKIVQTVYDKYASVMTSFQSKSSWVYADVPNSYDYDLEKAKKILDDAGWKEGADGIREKDGKKLQVHLVGTTNNPVVDALVPVATNDWKEIGVDFSSEVMQFPSMRQKIKKADGWDLYFMAHGLLANPDASLTYRTGAPQNWLGYSNAKVDGLFDTITAETDSDKLKDLYKDLYAEMNENLPEIPLYQRSDLYAFNGRVKNFKVSPYQFYGYYLYETELSE
ncbi:MAG: ABC transporter substrate-binding protein [Clostridium sp.]|nr:ABC transporter substrate-binding protein [Clostridium sp.]